MKNVLFVAIIEKIYDREMYAGYIKKAAGIIQSHNGKYVARSSNISQFSGSRPQRVIIVAFDSMEQATNCFLSEEYIKIRKLRENSTKSRAFFIEND